MAHPNLDVSRNNYYQKLDEEIEQAAEALRVLKSCRNALSPICRIPPELLSRIFVFHVHQAPTHRDEDDPDGAVWIGFSHVCKHWRVVALASAELWNSLDVVDLHPALREEMVIRSKLSPLDITCRWILHGDEEEYSEHVDFVRRYMSRARELSFSGTKGSLEGLFQTPIVAYPRESLESLTLTAEVSSSQPTCILPNAFIHGDFPRLHSISLWDCAINWVVPFCAANLTTLNLEQASREARATSSHFFAALKKMPMLKSLVLGAGALPEKHSSDPVCFTESIAVLRHLSYLQLDSCQPHEAASVLEHVRFPCGLSHLFLSTYGPLIDYLSLLLPALKERMSELECGTHNETIRRLHVERNGHSNSLLIHGDTEKEDRHRGLRSIYLSFYWECGELPSNHEVFLRTLQALSLTQVQILTVGRLPGALMSKEEWVELLSGLKELRTLKITGNFVDTLVSALSIPAVDTGADVVIPALRRLEFESVMFTMSTRPAPMFHTFRQCLVDRHAGGFKLQELQFKKCIFVQEADVRRLVDIGISVSQWDTSDIPPVDDFDSDC